MLFALEGYAKYNVTSIAETKNKENRSRKTKEPKQTAMAYAQKQENKEETTADGKKMDHSTSPLFNSHS